ncbi:MAG: hypothetical protein H0X38_02445 [Planctomycetes bacterium]|nr:hypothetical protein [Planctomycetota bacterium]
MGFDRSLGVMRPDLDMVELWAAYCEVATVGDLARRYSLSNEFALKLARKAASLAVDRAHRNVRRPRPLLPRRMPWVADLVRVAR